jgi:proteic killer suppression protein
MAITEALEVDTRAGLIRYAQRSTLGVVIRSFRCKETEKVFRRERSRKFASIAGTAVRKLVALHAATTLQDLRVPPGNALEVLSGDRAGQHSIRVNKQFRICFNWNDGHAENVEIVDYH